MFIPAVISFPFSKQYKRHHNFIYTDIPVQKCPYFSLPHKIAPGLTLHSLSKSIIKRIAKFDPDIVHVNWLYPCGLATDSLKRAGYHVVLTIHGSDWYLNIKNEGMYSLIKYSLSAADHVITVGEQLKRDVINRFPFLEKKITTIHNSVDTIFFKPPIEKNYAKKNLDWEVTDTHILCVANLNTVKGIDLLVSALTDIEFETDVKINVISSSQDKKYKRLLIKNLSETEWKNNITFHPSMDRNKLLKFYQASDIFVLPSRSESFGMALAEAGACGLPAIATKSGGPQEIISRETGILVEKDKDSIAKGIKNMLDNYRRYNSEEIQRHIYLNFSKSKKIEHLNLIYQTVFRD